MSATGLMSTLSSIVILTKNEEGNLPDCLASISWCDDIHVIDSGSSDRTLELALESGAHCRTNPFIAFGTQRNWALDNCDFRYVWVLFLDADERATPAFREALESAIRSASPATAGFYCCSKTMLEGRWLKRCDSFPKWQFRIVRVGKARFEDFGHGQREQILEGETRYLHEPYLHFAFSKGWEQWISRHNVYSTQEAELRFNRTSRLKELFSPHSAVRKKSLRTIASKTPGWPLLRFLSSYVFRLGFLEGRAGFNYSVNMAYYEFLIQLKMCELKKKTRADAF